MKNQGNMDYAPMPQDWIFDITEYNLGQFARMQEAIFKCGTMRLVGETAAKYELTDLQYTLMTEKERNDLFSKLVLLFLRLLLIIKLLLKINEINS